MTDKILLTKNQADALRADITEINQMIQIVQMKQASNKRMADMIVRDANEDPANFSEYKLEEKDGKTYLITQRTNGAPLLQMSGEPLTTN